jgi:hypothetical protein
MAEKLAIIDVAVSGMVRALRSLPGLLGIYWLPWLLGTIVLLILEVVLQDHLRLGWAPAWARDIVWAPFAAMTYLMLLRWVLNGQAPERPINLDVGRQTWIATPIVAAWLVSATAMSAAPLAMLPWLPTDALAEDHGLLFVLALVIVTWLIESAVLVCLFGLVVVVARFGQLAFSVYRHLVRLQPVRLFCICLLATAAVHGLRFAGSHALAWLGAGDLAPSTLIPWRAHIRQAFVAELPHFPLHFLEFAIEGSILAEAYRRLLSQPGGQPMTEAP